MISAQMTVETLNRSVLFDLREYIQREGLVPTVYTTRRQGIPYYLLTTRDGNEYVCSLAVYHYMMLKLSKTTNIRLEEDKKGEKFRVFPKTTMTVHKEKGAFTTIVYTDILKGDYTPEELINLSILPIEEEQTTE